MCNNYVYFLGKSDSLQMHAIYKYAYLDMHTYRSSDVYWTRQNSIKPTHDLNPCHVQVTVSYREKTQVYYSFIPESLTLV